MFQIKLSRQLLIKKLNFFSQKLLNKKSRKQKFWYFCKKNRETLKESLNKFYELIF